MNFLTSQQANSPEWKKYMYHANRAPGLWNQGLKRESIDEYLIAFQCAPTLTERYRFELFSEGTANFQRTEGGCVDMTIVPESALGYVEPTKKDINLIRKVFKDKNELRCIRMVAGHILGGIFGDRGDNSKQAETYYEAIRIGEETKISKYMKKIERKTKMYEDGMDKEMKSMQYLMDEIMKRLRFNYKNLTTGNSTNDPLPKEFYEANGVTPISSSQLSGLEPCTILWETLNYDLEAAARMTRLVGGSECDCCGKKEVLGKDSLFKCTRCKQAFYCSKECQKKSWKEFGHKEHCRKEGEIKPGDFISLHGLKKKQELNRKIGQVVGVVQSAGSTDSIRRGAEGTIKKDDERWEIKFDCDGKKNLSIAKKNLKQTRPLDCVQKQNQPKPTKEEIAAKALVITQSKLDQLHLAEGNRPLSKLETDELKILTMANKSFSKHKDESTMNDWFATVIDTAATTTTDLAVATRRNNNEQESSCVCSSCEGSCHCSPDGPMASWKNDKIGRFVFMGIVQYPHKHKYKIKLDDPRNLDGPGHVMDHMELCAEAFHYENPPKWTFKGRGPKSIQHLLRNCSSRPEPTSHDDNMRNSFKGRGMRGGKLVRYPFYSPSKISPPYSSNLPPKVRNDDIVWIVAERLNGNSTNERIPSLERFWVDVVSMTSGGFITGRSLSTLRSFPIHEFDWVYFPVSCVLDVERGKHWM